MSNNSCGYFSAFCCEMQAIMMKQICCYNLGVITVTVYEQPNCLSFSNVVGNLVLLSHNFARTREIAVSHFPRRAQQPFTTGNHAAIEVLYSSAKISRAAPFRSKSSGASSICERASLFVLHHARTKCMRRESIWLPGFDVRLEDQAGSINRPLRNGTTIRP